MSFIHERPFWAIPGARATDERLVLNRREFVSAIGAAGAVAAGILPGCDRGVDAEAPPGPATRPSMPGLYPAKRNAKYTLDRKLSRRDSALRYVNYYEFDASNKSAAVRLAQKLVTYPWSVEVSGLVRHPKRFDVDDLVRRFPLEERLYRHRCVETWAMAVPWTGFPLRLLLDAVEPLPQAKYVRFVSFLRPKQAPGQQSGSTYPWPYHEGLRLDEARNELALLATGIYGQPLPKQNGAPIRLVVPWKYGYKSIKAIERIELVAQRPPTFWNSVSPVEYGFESNVNPKVP
ncbi:MAG: protein-methionine-sulfoxide reductase catalytic subunit MsrP, partial [Phycisphaerae bacterium]